jgi:hypothetical protein
MGNAGQGGLSHPYGLLPNMVMGNMMPLNSGLAQQVMSNSGMMMQQNPQISLNMSQMQSISHSNHNQVLSHSNHNQVLSHSNHNQVLSHSNHNQGLSHSNHNQGLSHSNHNQGLSHSNHNQVLSHSIHNQVLSHSNHNQVLSHSNHNQVNAIQDGYGNDLNPQLVMSGGAMNRQGTAGLNQGMPYGDTEALQNKLASIYPSVEHFEPRPIANVSQQYQQKPRQSAQTLEKGVPASPSQNPRRKPPPSLLKRDDSLKMEKIFSGGAKVKYDDNGSSTHMSAMSLSIGDMADDGNLSSVFDSSLRISGEGKNNSKLKRSAQETSSSVLTTSHWDAASHTMDMSVNTFGAGHSINEFGAGHSTNEFGIGPVNEEASFATYQNKMNESEGNMSFSRVFEDPDKGL